MLLGLPWTAWLLIVLATVPSFVTVLVFYRAHGRDDASPSSPR